MHFDALLATRLVGCLASAHIKRLLAWVPVSGPPSHALDALIPGFVGKVGPQAGPGCGVKGRLVDPSI